MNDNTRRQICLTINHLDVNQLKKLIDDGHFTIDEIIECGLVDSKVNELSQAINIQNDIVVETNKKDSILTSILHNNISLYDLFKALDDRIISHEDIRDLAGRGQISQNLATAIIKKHQTKQTNPPFRNVTELPPMEDGRTDLYFIGLAGSGKSTMLAGLLNYANKEGLLITDPYHQIGVNYQNKLIQDLVFGILPGPTQKGSYNYIALSIMDKDKVKHPFNIVDVPGEVFASITNNPKVDDFLNYIKNDNKKILIFVMDSDTHNNRFMSDDTGLDQTLIFPNILQILKSNNVLESTDAIYLVVNKFDRISSDFEMTDNSVLVADSFVNNEFKNLLWNCQDIKKESKNKFKIKVVPYTIGKIAMSQLVESFSFSYSQNLFSNLLDDSFVVKGGWWTRIFR
jgi:hypothetical protein